MGFLSHLLKIYRGEEYTPTTIPKGKLYKKKDLKLYWIGKKRVYGYSPHIPKVGDRISRKGWEYTFTKVKQCDDPKDMFFASLEEVNC